MDIMDKILGFIMSAQGASATIAMVLEFVLRLIPSEQPLSIAHLVGSIIKKAGAVLVALGDLLDKILPQKLK